MNSCTSPESSEIKLPTPISIRLTREELRAQRLHELANIFESAFESLSESEENPNWDCSVPEATSDIDMATVNAVLSSVEREK